MEGQCWKRGIKATGHITDHLFTHLLPYFQYYKRLSPMIWFVLPDSKISLMSWIGGRRSPQARDRAAKTGHKEKGHEKARTRTSTRIRKGNRVIVCLERTFASLDRILGMVNAELSHLKPNQGPFFVSTNTILLCFSIRKRKDGLPMTCSPRE